MVKMLRYFLFLPSITFKIVPAEIFPWATIYSIVWQGRSVSRSFLIILLLLTFSSIYGLYTTDGDYSQVLRSVSSYINPLIVFFALLSISDREIDRIAKSGILILFVSLFFGILQKLNVVSFLEPIIDLLMERGQVSEFGGGRGISLLSSEPSRAAVELIFFYILFVGYFKISGLRKNLFLSVMVFFVLFLIKSATGLLTLIVFFLVFYTRLTLFFFLIFSFFIPVIYSMSGYFSEDVRIFYLLHSIMGLKGVEIFNFIVSASGNRIVSTLGSYLYSFHHVIGGGIGAWQDSSIDAMKITGISPESLAYFRQVSFGSYSSVRPPSFMASIALDMGILGMVVFSTSLYFGLRKYTTEENKKYVYLLALYLFSFSSIGNPIPWIVIAIMIRKNTRVDYD
ncbi:hypothetical protein [Vibrio harveyi]|uniref:hypothetical protein n=1 Tax=Vibrio harveyi TaxID=669 RepID=UPI0018F1F7BD|nr:hypothetical protein [Vibrio harveyi]